MDEQDIYGQLPNSLIFVSLISFSMYIQHVTMGLLGTISTPRLIVRLCYQDNLTRTHSQSVLRLDWEYGGITFHLGMQSYLKK